LIGFEICSGLVKTFAQFWYQSPLHVNPQSPAISKVQDQIQLGASVDCDKIRRLVAYVVKLISPNRLGPSNVAAGKMPNCSWIGSSSLSHARQLLGFQAG
jgi:hypothetical protein